MHSHRCNTCGGISAIQPKSKDSISNLCQYLLWFVKAKRVSALWGPERLCPSRAGGGRLFPEGAYLKWWLSLCWHSRPQNTIQRDGRACTCAHTHALYGALLTVHHLATCSSFKKQNMLFNPSTHMQSQWTAGLVLTWLSFSEHPETCRSEVWALTVGVCRYQSRADPFVSATPHVVSNYAQLPTLHQTCSFIIKMFFL